ncbi:MAG: hypothetical protein U0Z44_16590 [Kouleothrix sp.]
MPISMSIYAQPALVCTIAPDQSSPVIWRLVSLSKREDVVFVEQALLTNEVIHRVVRFEDLWDILTYRSTDNQLSPEEMKKAIDLLDDFGYREETGQVMAAGVLKIRDIGQLTQQKKEQLKSLLLEQIFEAFPFNRSSEDSEGVGWPLLRR